MSQKDYQSKARQETRPRQASNKSKLQFERRVRQQRGINKGIQGKSKVKLNQWHGISVLRYRTASDEGI